MAGNIIVSLLSAFDDKGIKDAEKAFSALTGKVKAVGKNLALGVGSYMIGSQAVHFVQESANAAMELQRNMEGVKTIFGAATPAIQKYIAASEQLGMSHAAAAKATTFLGSVFKQTGMPMDEVVTKTEKMVSLGADLAATYGYSVEEALTAMTATFRGEYDPIEKFGVAMKQQQVNAELAARGLKGLTGSALIAAQQQIRYELILQRTTDAQGAFQRSSGNLFQQQQILKAEFTDLQAKLGSLLIPALIKLAEAIKPMIEKLGPRLAEVFKVIADMLVQLAPLLPQFADKVVQAFGALATVMRTVYPLLSGIVGIITSNPAAVLAFVGALKIAPQVIKNWSQIKYEIQFANLAIETFTTRTKEATVAQTALNAVSRLNPYVLIATTAIGAATAIGDISGKMVENYQKQTDIRAEAMRLNAVLKRQGQHYLDLSKISSDYAGVGRYGGTLEANAWQKALEKLQNYEKAYKREQLMLSQAPTAAQINAHHGWTPVEAALGNTQQTSAKVKTWFDTLSEEVKKQSKRVALGKMGLSKVLIDSLLSASDWQSAVARVMGMTKSQIKKLIADFGKTSAAQDAAAADLAERTSKFVDAVRARIDTIKSLTNGIASFMPRTLSDVTAQVGQFESDVLSAADTLRSSLAAALDNNEINTAAYNNLTTYANREIKVMQDLATARDRLAKKIEYAKQVYIEVAQAVRGYGNITSATTTQVTESYKKIIDGVEVTVSRTVDALQSKDLVANYKAIVDKTKAFLANLTQLKKMGLNQTLFKQIIDAGIDAGGATAEAIVQGGSDTVSSLNDMFMQLDAAGAQMADLTASVMQDNGITIVSAFIDGLTSQEKTLSDAAKSMAQIFSDAFNNNVRFVVPTINPSTYGLTTSQANAALTAAGLPTDQGGAGKNNFATTVADAITPAIKEIIDVVVPPTIPAPIIPVPVVSTAVTAPVEVAAAKVADMLTTAAAQLPSYMQAEISAMTDTANAANTGFDRFKPADLAAFAANVASLPAYMQNEKNAMTNSYVINVTAGLGTDGTSVGQAIVNYIKQYERNNGAVWTAA